MKHNIVPIAVAAVLIVSLTLVQAKMSDRWTESTIDAAEFGERFAQVPMKVGPWLGEDQPVDEITRKTAGAVNYVSRHYTHSTSGRMVELWLIVGHSKDICRHTPNICYPSAGFSRAGSQLRQHVDSEGQDQAVFHTAKFEKSDHLSRQILRVFWAWNEPERNVWEAPKNARLHYGLSRALYKLYFTSAVMPDEDTIDDNIAVEFAELMLPEINKALFPEAEPTDDATAEAQPEA